MTKWFAQVLAVSLVAGGFLAGAGVAEAQNERFMSVMERGEIRVGVKAAYKPWGFRDPSGALVGMEPDMAQLVADAMGVKLTLVAVESSNRMQFLQQGKIDLMIATLTDLSQRRELVGAVDPNYYTSGSNMLARKSLGLKSWEDLRGKPVCTRQGSFHNKPVQQQFGATLVAFPGQAEAKQAMMEKRCIGFLGDDSGIQNDLQNNPVLAADFEMPLNTKWATPWAVAVPLEERESIWGNFMSGLVYNWLASGKLLEIEAKWGIQPSDYLVEKSAHFAYQHEHLKK